MMTADEAVRSCEKLIQYHADIVSRRAPGVDSEDLYQVGAMEVVKAAGMYDPSRGASFGTFVHVRVVGAMIDYLREQSWAPRLEVMAAKAEGRPLVYMEPLSSVRITHARQVNRYGRGGPLKRTLFPRDGVDIDPACHDPEPDESEEELVGRLRAMRVVLSHKEREAVVAYFARDMLQHEVAKAIGVSESRAGQLIRGVLLRAGMKGDKRILAHGHKGRMIKGNKLTSQGGASF